MKTGFLRADFRQGLIITLLSLMKTNERLHDAGLLFVLFLNHLTLE